MNKATTSLIEAASAIRKNSYSPYSNYAVACAVLLKDGHIISGVNIENASYPVGVCAEIAALAQVVSKGLQKEIEALLVLTASSPPAAPCGKCRQFLLEFLEPLTPIYLANDKGEQVATLMKDLLSHPFQRSSLL